MRSCLRSGGTRRLAHPVATRSSALGRRASAVLERLHLRSMMRAGSTPRCGSLTRVGAPRLETNVRRLREEHPEIVQRIDETIARLEQVEIGEDTWPLEQARDDLQRFMGSVIRHRQRGADLVWEAYNVDIGGIE